MRKISFSVPVLRSEGSDSTQASQRGSGVIELQYASFACWVELRGRQTRKTKLYLYDSFMEQFGFFSPLIASISKVYVASELQHTQNGNRGPECVLTQLADLCSAWGLPDGKSRIRVLIWTDRKHKHACVRLRCTRSTPSERLVPITACTATAGTVKLERATWASD